MTPWLRKGQVRTETFDYDCMDFARDRYVSRRLTMTPWLRKGQVRTETFDYDCMDFARDRYVPRRLTMATWLRKGQVRTETFDYDCMDFARDRNRRVLLLRHSDVSLLPAGIAVFCCYVTVTCACCSQERRIAVFCTLLLVVALMAGGYYYWARHYGQKEEPIVGEYVNLDETIPQEGGGGSVPYEQQEQHLNLKNQTKASYGQEQGYGGTQ
ncbi:Hypp5 [Branchiostoma lanceolatum]|uniref:Hypp5 protein n=1 Tax=Branchiostoma lanceolatum TaxID=7740 RepID=A0A8J9YH96_BRALA|nr:Hypp5 [Branchiostoma lanceolatum]